MSFFKDFRGEIKTLVIVMLIAVAIIGGAWIFLDLNKSSRISPTAFVPDNPTCRGDECVGVPDSSSISEFSAQIIGSYASPGESSKLVVSGDTVYLTDISQGLLAIDVSDPTNPKLLDSVKVNGGGAYAIAVHRSQPFPVLVGGYGNSKIALVDVSDPKNLQILARGDAKRSVLDITQVGSSWYLVIDGPEFEVFSRQSGVLKSFGTVPATPGGHVLSLAVHETVNAVLEGELIVWISDQKLVAAQGEKGLATFDLRVDPPQLKGVIELVDGYGYAVGVDNNSSQAKDIVYVISGQNLILVNIADEANPEVKGKVSLSGSGEAINVQSGIAVVAMWDKGVEIIDVQDPENPVSLGVVDTPGRARDVAIQPLRERDDPYTIYVADDRDDLQIIEFRR